MARISKCPRCQHSKSWKVRRGKRRCAACRYEWTPGALPLRLTRSQWRKLLRWFILEQSTDVIARESRLERKRVLRALHLVRQAMARDAPPAFPGAVDLDKPLMERLMNRETTALESRGRTSGRRTTKQAVFRILWREGQALAEVIPELEARTLLPVLKKTLLEQAVRKDSVTLPTSTGIAAGGHMYHLVDGRQSFRGGRGGRLDSLEGFWNYLKRRLLGRGGVSLDRLPLFLAEYVWRYNHRNLSVPEQVKRSLRLIER